MADVWCQKFHLAKKFAVAAGDGQDVASASGPGGDVVAFKGLGGQDLAKELYTAAQDGEKYFKQMELQTESTVVGGNSIWGHSDPPAEALNIEGRPPTPWDATLHSYPRIVGPNLPHVRKGPPEAKPFFSAPLDALGESKFPMPPNRYTPSLLTAPEFK